MSGSGMLGVDRIWWTWELGSEVARRDLEIDERSSEPTKRIVSTVLLSSASSHDVCRTQRNGEGKVDDFFPYLTLTKTIRTKVAMTCVKKVVANCEV